MDTLISVLIVTWNRRDDVLATIRSVVAQRYPHVEIVVVDNGSTDGTVEAIRAVYPDVKLVPLDRNRGIAAGRNAGIPACTGEIIFCLDSDASPHPDALGTVARKFQDDPALGAINSKIVNATTGQQDRIAGWVYSEADRADQDREFLSYSFSEGGCALRKRVVDEVGPFWDRLFFGREGEELSLRIWDAGYTVRYVPQSLVYHRVSPHRRVGGGDRLYYDLRNALYIYLARYPWWMLVRFVPLKIATSLVKGTRQRCLGNILKALFDVARHLPDIWRQRHPIRRDTARRYLKLQREHGPLRWNLATWLRHKA
jgi:GT2 family glycosyltransferase